MRTFLISLALVLVACGGGDLADDPQASTEPESTTTVAAAGSVAAFFLDDSGGNKARFGPFLAPAARTGDGVTAALAALIAGPTSEEAGAGLSSAVPADTVLRGVAIDGDVATVDLSGAFDDGGGTFSMSARLAQLTYTVTAADPAVRGVLVALDGEVVTVFSSEGLMIEEPMTRDDFQDLLPGILVEAPARGEAVAGALEITGVAAAFEAVFQLEVVDSEGNAVATVPFVQTDNGMGWGSFSVSFSGADLPGSSAELAVHVFELSAEDGSVISERFVPFSWRP